MGDLLSTLIGLNFGAVEFNSMFKYGVVFFYGTKIIISMIITILFFIANKYIVDKTSILIMKITMVMINSTLLIVIIKNILVIFTQVGMGYF